MPTPPAGIDQLPNADQLARTVDQLRADLAKHKRRLDKAARKETELETLLLNSEGDIEALRARLTASQIERDLQRTQSHKYEASLKQQHRAQLDELKQSNAQLRSKLDQSPSAQQFETLQNALRDKVQQLEALSTQSHAAAEMQSTHTAQINQRDALLLEAREQLEASQHQITQYEKQLATAVSQSNQETLHFEALFAEKDSLFDDLKQQLSAAQFEQQTLRAKLQRTTSDLESRPSIEHCKSLQDDLLRRNDDLRTVRQDFGDMRARAESLREKYDREIELNKEKELQLQKSSVALQKIRQDMSRVSDEAESLRCNGHQQAKQIEEQQKAIENSRQLLEKAQSQANSINDEFEKSSQAFRTERDGLLTKLEEAKALINQRPEPEQYQTVLTELEENRNLVEKLEAQLARAQKDADISRHISEQQGALITERESVVQSLEQQLSHAREQMIAMKSQFESQLNVSAAEKTQISSRIQMVEDQLNKRPKEEEYLQLKSALEHNMLSLNALQADKDKVNGELHVLRSNYDSQQTELNEKHTLLVEAKNELIECEKRIATQESRHDADLKRHDHTLSEKDDFISELKSQLQEHQEQLSDATATFEKEREQLRLTLSETRKSASLELSGFEESRVKSRGELCILKAQIEDAENELVHTKTKLGAAEHTISLKDSALASLRTSEAALRTKTKELSARVTTLENKLKESDKLIDEASKTSKRVVQVQTDIHEKEVARLRVEISSAKSARDMSATLLGRVVQRIKQVCVSCIGNEEVQSIEIDENKSDLELQILANNLIVSVEEHLQNRTHLQSELRKLESREENMKKMISSLETEKEALSNSVADAQRVGVERDSRIQALTKKANELEKLAVSYKLFSEESETRLQNQEEAAEITLTSLSEELRIKEHEYDQLLVANKTTEAKVDELCHRLKEKEDLEGKITEMKHVHAKELKKMTLQREKLECEKSELAGKLKQTLEDISEAQKSLETMTQTQTQLQSKCKGLEAERNTQLASRSALEKRNHEFEVQIREANAKIENLSLTLDEKTSHHTDAMASNEMRLQELETLRIELKNVTESRIGLEVQLSESSKEKDNKIQTLSTSLREKDEELLESSQRCETAAKTILALESELSRSQASLVESQSRARDENSALAENLREVELKRSELERALQDSQDSSTNRLADVERLNLARIKTLEAEIQKRQQKVDRLVDVETELRAETEALSVRLHEVDGKYDDIEKALRQCEDLATKRLTEIERLNADIIPSLKDISERKQNEVERLSSILESRSKEWSNASASAATNIERTMQELEEAKKKLYQSEVIVMERNGVIDRLKAEQDAATVQLEQMQAKMGDMARLRNGDVERLQQEVGMYRQEAAESDMRLRRKESELLSIETHLREAREKCAHLEKEKEKISVSAAESQDSNVELSELQRVHERLLTKVVKLQRRARRAEKLLQHEKKKHLVIAKKLDVESKRQVSPSTKGLSPAMKRPRAHSLRPPLSPTDGNSRPPMIPKAHQARRSLDFGA